MKTLPFNGNTAERSASDITFEPIPAHEEAVGFEASLEPEVFHAVGLKREVTLDGCLGDPAWVTAPLIPEMKNMHSKTPLGPPTDVRLLYSPTALYIGAVMHEPDMEHLVAQFDQNDLGIYNDDCLELIVDPTGRPHMFYHIVVNALGSIFDARDGKVNWNGDGFVAATSRHADKWIVELKLPYAAFDNLSMPEPGEFWGLRVARERHHDQGAVAVPMLRSGSLNARQYLGKLVFEPSASGGIELSCAATKFAMGMNTLPMEIAAAKPTAVRLRARVYDAQSDILSEVTQDATAPTKLDFALPVETDNALRTVVSLLTEDGESVDSVVLGRDFPYVAPGFDALDKELRLIEGGCADLLAIDHPIHRGAADSIARMRAAIAEYRATVATAIADGRTVDAAVTADFAALENGFKEFKNRYSYLVWQTSPWETGTPDALPPLDYSTELSLTYQQASNERERVALIFSGLLCGRRLDLRLVPYSIDDGTTYVPRDRFEIYLEPFTDHNGTLNTNPLIRVPGDIITLTPGESVRVHVVFNSNGVKPGNYQTKIELKPLYDYSVPNREVPVEMDIWNFSIPETRDFPLDCFFWGPNTVDNDESAMLRLMHSRHINWGWTESVRYTKGFKGMHKLNTLPEGKVFDPEMVKNANDKFFRTAKELGMRFVFGWGTCASVEWHQLMDERLMSMGFSRDDFIYKGLLLDEFKKKDIPLNGEIRKEIAKVNPGWTFQATYLSSPPPSGATLADIDEAHLTDTHKNWTLISGLLRGEDEKTKEVTDFFKDRGCSIWAYECAQTMHTQPVLEYYRFFPWFGYRKKLDGVAIWTTIGNSRDGNEDGLDHRDGYDDGATVLDSNGQPIPTKRLEAVSKGLEDVAYMFELEKQLKRLDAKLSEVERERYTALITSRLGEIVQNASQDEVDAWHTEVGTTIDRLSRL